jgi:hypothetical protein
MYMYRVSPVVARPPQPLRKITTKTNTLILSMKMSSHLKIGTDLASLVARKLRGELWLAELWRPFYFEGPD